MEEKQSNIFRGFLGFYIVFFIIFILFTMFNSLGIFEYVVRILNKEYLKNPIFNGFIFTLSFLFTIFSIYVLYLTLSKKRIAKLFNIVYLWVLFLLPIIYDLIDWLIPPNY